MSAGQLPPPGTVLRKIDRNGAVRCEAIVGENGQVIYRGVTYSSISAAAKVAAGDIGLAARSCDGYAFFGLKNRSGESVPRAVRTVSALPLPLPVRWDDIFEPAVEPAQLVLVAPAAVPVPSVPLDHNTHGRADVNGAPLDADCACRGSALETACAEAGCGYCRAARMAVVAPVVVQARADLSRMMERDLPTDPAIRPGPVSQEVLDVLDEMDAVAPSPTTGLDDGSCVPIRRCTKCGYATSIGFSYKTAPCINGEHDWKDFPNGESAADLEIVKELVSIPAPGSSGTSEPAPVRVERFDAERIDGARIEDDQLDIEQPEWSPDEIAEEMSQPSQKDHNIQAIDFAYGNLAATTNHKPEREAFRALWVRRGLLAAEFDAWADKRAWYEQPPLVEAAVSPAPLTDPPSVPLSDRVHDLKCWPVPFAAILDGSKTFEWRKNDRDYRVGDMLHLREWTSDGERYTGRTVDARVTYMLDGGFNIPDGYCIMGIARIGVAPASPNHAADVSQMRADLLQEIDDVIQGTAYWQGGRLDTIKHLLARVEKTEAEAAVRGGEWCAANRAAGHGPCASCAWCCGQATERAERAEALLVAAKTELREQEDAKEAAYRRLYQVDEKSKDRPRIVCLCGSTKFRNAFAVANRSETIAGRIVLLVGFFGHSGDTLPSAEDKEMLDELHKRKIDLADEVLVLNVGGYIGASTRSEIDYAVAHGKPVRYLEQIDQGLAHEGPLAVPASSSEGDRRQDAGAAGAAVAAEARPFGVHDSTGTAPAPDQPVSSNEEGTR